MQTKNANNNTVRFRRFTRRSYAVFASLHREVTIGTLQGSTIDSQLRKSGLGVEILKFNKIGDSERQSTINEDEDICCNEMQQLITISLSKTDAAAASAGSILSPIKIATITDKMLLLLFFYAKEKDISTKIFMGSL